MVSTKVELQRLRYNLRKTELAYDKVLENLEELVCLALDCDVITQDKARELLGLKNIQTLVIWHNIYHNEHVKIGNISRILGE